MTVALSDEMLRSAHTLRRRLPPCCEDMAW